MKITTLFGERERERDKAIRDEARFLVVELYKWIGPALKSHLTILQPVQLTELDAEFAKVEGHKPSPTRFLRSWQQKQSKMASENIEAEDNKNDRDADELDFNELATPVDTVKTTKKLL